MEKGFLALILHAHLPYVRHPEHEYFLEENWYYEALFETYLPLLDTFERLAEKKIPFQATLSLSPTLLSMFLDPLLSKRATRYADELIALAQREKKRVGGHPAFEPVVDMYLAKLRKYREKFLGDYQGNPALGFKKLQEQGQLEIITCGATHGYLPLLSIREAAVRAQVGTALRLYESVFGRKSRGFWLPECGYQPGLERILSEAGLRYFFLESHGLLQALPRPKYGTFAPGACLGGVVAFGRDQESSKQVWSAEEGYPGDPEYREFYRDIGFDLKEEQLKPYLNPEGFRRFSGLKYFKVTGPTAQKKPYDPLAALAKAREHAEDFLDRRTAQLAQAAKWMDRPPQVTSLYDAELFGHWWYEGPDFLYFLFEGNAKRGGPLQCVTPSTYLDLHPANQPIQPAFSSWGKGGYSEFWLNETNDWIYPLLNQACDEMTSLAGRFPDPSGPLREALDQAARELLLAQASDWAFMIKTGNHRPYAESRIKIHLSRFHRLGEQVRAGKIDPKFLSQLQEKDNLFPDVDYRVFRPS